MAALNCIARNLAHRAPRRKPRLLRNLNHPCARTAPPGGCGRSRHTASSPTQNPASAEQAKPPPRRPTSCTLQTTSPHTPSSAIAIPASCSNSFTSPRQEIQFTPHLLPIPRGHSFDNLSAASAAINSAQKTSNPSLATSTRRARSSVFVETRTSPRYSTS